MPQFEIRKAALSCALLAAACGPGAFTGDEHDVAPIMSHRIDSMDLSGEASTHAASAPLPLSYHGGLGGQGVELKPVVYLVLWGSQWKSDPSQEAAILQGFYAGLANSAWANTLTQYCQTVASGATGCSAKGAQLVVNQTAFGGTWQDTATPAPANPTQAQLAAEAVKAAAHFNNKTAASNLAAQYVIALPHGLAVSGFGTQWCAWHSAASSAAGNLSYTFLPYISDAGGACGGNFVNAGAAGQRDGITIVAGHEWAESVTDGWVGTGWYDAQGSEIGDKCAWIRAGQGASANVKFATGNFPVQSLWSNAFNKGAGGCVVSYP